MPDMYNINDTITAVSSTSPVDGVIARSIIRISGSKTFDVLSGIFFAKNELNRRGITTGKIHVDRLGQVDATVYTFPCPHSYTGEDLAEIHIFAAPAVIQYILKQTSCGARLAEPGEFTLRAYLNGKMDLAQAEAVAEIVSSSNTFQLAAAQKLLAGALSETAAMLREQLLDVLSLIEAGMDFSTEDIEFVTKEEAIDAITKIKNSLKELLESSIRYEEMIDLASVGIAGAPNAGKSSLANTLLGQDRSIVSGQAATTRDVLTGVLELAGCDCAMFDCAGLKGSYDTDDVLDGLAQQAAVEALNTAQLVLFCIDAGKKDYAEDIALTKLFHPQQLVPVITKCDLVTDRRLKEIKDMLSGLFSMPVATTSTVSMAGVDELCLVIEKVVISQRAGSAEAAERIAITERHRKSVEEAIKNLDDAADEMNIGNDEVATMLLRDSCQGLSGLVKEDIDEVILGRIFSRFCIGK